MPGREGWILLGILSLTVIVHGWRAAFPFYIRGDLLYHWGLTHTILLGSFPPEGPYIGLPSYYPPGFHLILAGLGSLPGLDVPTATALLGIVWLPVIPLGAFLLAKRLTGRGDVGLVAAALTAFAGGFDVSNDRLWVNAMSLAGHVAYPVYPRDLVFGLLPFAVLAFLGALEGARYWVARAVLAGLILGIAALIQIQLLLPIPVALATVGLVAAWRGNVRWRVAIGSLLATGFVALAVVGPWLVWIGSVIARNGGVAIDSSEDLEPIRIGFWNFPIQFGLILPLAVIGAGMVVLLARSRIDSIEGWTPRPPDGALVLLPWWILPFALAVAYDPGWPLEDALRPQRMWTVASQPALILAAIGLVAGIGWVTRARSRRGEGVRERAAVALAIAIIMTASLPGTIATARLVSSLWTDARYAHLRLDQDHVPDMATLFDPDRPRPTILTYEDWSSLVWYHTGAGVVAVEPPGYAKLAFDPAAFTGFGQTQRRSDLAAALAGDAEIMRAMADRYDADEILLARRTGGRLGTIGLPAAIVAGAGGVAGPSEVVQGNGWDAVALAPGSSMTLPLEDAGGSLDLEIRVWTVGAPSAPRFLVRVEDGPPIEVSAPLSLETAMSVVRVTVDRPADGAVVIEAIDPVTIQGVLGFVAEAGPPSGWVVATTTPDAVVWRREP